MTTPRAQARRSTAYVVLAVVSVLAAYLSAQISVNRAQKNLEAVAVATSQQARENSVAGCERTKQDRMDAIVGWSAARQARLRTAHTSGLPQKERLAAASAAATYRQVIDGYRGRIVDCQKAFPPVNVKAVREFIRDTAQ